VRKSSVGILSRVAAHRAAPGDEPVHRPPPLSIPPRENRPARASDLRRRPPGNVGPPNRAADHHGPVLHPSLIRQLAVRPTPPGKDPDGIILAGNALLTGRIFTANRCPLAGKCSMLPPSLTLAASPMDLLRVYCVRSPLGRGPARWFSPRTWRWGGALRRAVLFGRIIDTLTGARWEARPRGFLAARGWVAFGLFRSRPASASPLCRPPRPPPPARGADLLFRHVITASAELPRRLAFGAPDEGDAAERTGYGACGSICSAILWSPARRSRPAAMSAAETGGSGRS